MKKERKMISEFEKVRNDVSFEMFDRLTKKKVLKLLDFFGTYIIEYEKKIKRSHTYFDTTKNELERSGIVLEKFVSGKTAKLLFYPFRKEKQGKYLTEINKKAYFTPISPNENIMKKSEFLRDSLRDLLNTTLAFDPDFFFKESRIKVSIKTQSEEYKLIGALGLKARLTFNDNVYTNFETGRISKDSILNVYQLSDKSTDEDFEDLISKMERYCKELDKSSEILVTHAKRITKEFPKVDKKAYEEQKRKENTF